MVGKVEGIVSLFSENRMEDMTTWMSVLLDDEGHDLVDINKVELVENPPAFPEKIVDEKYRELWESCGKMISGKSLLGLVYWKLGREVGIVQRVMKENHISWGTYDDLLGVHCNGHTNNLVLLQNNVNK